MTDFVVAFNRKCRRASRQSWGFSGSVPVPRTARSIWRDAGAVIVHGLSDLRWNPADPARNLAGGYPAWRNNHPAVIDRAPPYA
jgi:hypothetical protein